MEQTQNKINNLTDRYIDIIHKISVHINDRIQEVEKLPPTLMGGTIGIAMFLSRYALAFDHEDSYNNMKTLVSNALMNPSLGNGSASVGISGLFYGYQNLLNNDLLDGPVDFLPNIDNILLAEANKYLDQKNYDLLHGAMGIGMYFVERNKTANTRNYLEEITKRILALKVKDNNYTYWISHKKFNQTNDAIDLGFAHGLPSIITFLSLMYEHDILKQEIKEEVHRCMEFILSLRDKNFPTYVSASDYSKQGPKRIRLAWCYGDMGVAWALWNCGKVFNNEEWKKFGIDIFTELSTKNFDNAGAVDVCVCHGTVGIAYLFNRMHKDTSIAAFREAEQYWLEKTVQLKEEEPDLEGLYFKNFTPETGIYEKLEHLGLLTGHAGVGLSLLDIAHKEIDSTWSKCFYIY